MEVFREIEKIHLPRRSIYIPWALAFRMTGYEKHLKGRLSAICQEAIENVLDRIDVAEGRVSGELPPECFEIAEKIVGYCISELPIYRPRPQLKVIKGGKNKEQEATEGKK